MRRSVAFSALGLLAVALAGPGSAGAQVIRDRHVEWRSLRTDHFDVHYHVPLGVVARRTAAVLERAHARLTRALRHAPDGRTHVVITDDSEGSNGSASVLPRRVIRLFATAPEDLTPLDDYEDWLTELVVHEHTHILHLDNIGGLPRIINAIFGRVYAPGSMLPPWFVEGLAVHEESAHTAGGRIRGTMFDMFLRMDALDDRLLRLDQISNDVDRLPFGNTRYLYGSRFVDYLAQRFGHHALVDMVEIAGRQAIPFGNHRVALRATGHDFGALYDDFRAHLRERYDEVRRRVEAQGRVEGTRITTGGYTARAPRFLNDREVVYYASTERDLPSLFVVDARTGERRRDLGRVRGTPYPSPHPDGRHLWINQIEQHRDIYSYNDLFTIDLDDGERTQMTFGLRAREPDVSPDGRRVVFAVNGASTRHLLVADTRDVMATRRVLHRSRRFEQVYTPRWSPDGQRVAFSQWSHAGHRDIVVIDVASGTLTKITDDRALDTGPCWSPDGRVIYFSSDRTGIANVYAHELDGGRTRQVTNVLGGAYSPDVSPDGRRMVYLGYASDGFDLWTLPLDEARMPVAAPYVDDRPAARWSQEIAHVESARYEPRRTILPRAWTLDVAEDGFGTSIGALVEGGDVLGHHTYSAQLAVGLERGDVGADVTYTYQRLAAPVSLRLFRAVNPRSGLSVGGESRRWIEDTVGGRVSVVYGFRHDFGSEGLSASYQLSHARKAEPFGGVLDPNTPPPELPETGLSGRASIGWSFSNVAARTLDVTPSHGQRVSLSLSVSDPSIGSRTREGILSWSFTQYLNLPWIPHHVLALRYGGGYQAGDRTRAAFSVGGFPDASLLDQLIEVSHLGGVALRGYDPFGRAGNQFHLLQSEYRFPIFRPQAGVGLFPVYAFRLSGAVFADYGHAFFGQLRPEEFRLGVGAELHANILLGYFLSMFLRVGFAYGVHEDGGPQAYAHFGVPF